MLFFCYSVKYPTAITSVIEADYNQKVVMKFSLKSESSGDLFTPHQARINQYHLPSLCLGMVVFNLCFIFTGFC